MCFPRFKLIVAACVVTAILWATGCDDVPQRRSAAPPSTSKASGVAWVNPASTRRRDWSFDDDGRFVMPPVENEFAFLEQYVANGPYRRFLTPEDNRWHPPAWLAPEDSHWIEASGKDLPVQRLLKIAAHKLSSEWAFDIAPNGTHLHALAGQKLISIDLQKPDRPEYRKEPIEAAIGIRCIPNTQSIYLFNETTIAVYSLKESKILASKPLPAAIRSWQRAALSDRILAFTGDDLWITWDSRLESIDTLEGYSAKEALQLSTQGDYVAWEEDYKLHRAKLFSEEAPDFSYPSGWLGQTRTILRDVVLIPGKSLYNIGTADLQFYSTFKHRLKNAKSYSYQRDGKDFALCVGSHSTQDGDTAYLGVNLALESDECSQTFVIPVSYVKRMEVSQNGERFAVLDRDHVHVFERSPLALWNIESVFGAISKRLIDSKDFVKLEELLQAIRSSAWGNRRVRGEYLLSSNLTRIASYLHQIEDKFYLDMMKKPRENAVLVDRKIDTPDEKWRTWIDVATKLHKRIGYEQSDWDDSVYAGGFVEGEPLQISIYRLNYYRGDLKGLFELARKILHEHPEHLEVHMAFLNKMRSHPESRKGMDIKYIEEAVKAYRAEDQESVKMFLAWTFMSSAVSSKARQDETPEEYLQLIRTGVDQMIESNDWIENDAIIERLAVAGSLLRDSKLEERLRIFARRHNSITRLR